MEQEGVARVKYWLHRVFVKIPRATLKYLLYLHTWLKIKERGA